MVVVFATLAGWVSLHRLWFFEGLRAGQVEVGYFEERAGRVGLALYAEAPDEVLHKAGVDARGRASLPPGTSVALPLADGASYRVSADEGVPYVVLGAAVAETDGAGSSRSSRLFGSPVAPEASGGSVVLEPWRIEAPWHSDEQRLLALGTTCGVQPGQRDVVITRHGNDVDLTLGACSRALALPPAAASGSAVLVVLAGPTWSFVEGVDRPLSIRRVWRPKVVGALAAAFCLVLAAFGPITGIVVDVFAVVAAPFLPVPVAVGIGLTAVLALLTLAVRLFGFLVPPSRRARVVAAVAVPLVGLLLYAASRRPDAVPAAPRPGCLLTGYSMAAGSGVRRGDGVYELLRNCASCNGSVSRHAKSAETFQFVQALVCNDQLPVAAGTKLVFLGAANDDIMFLPTRNEWLRVLSRGMFLGREYFRRKPGMASLDSLVDAGSARALRAAGVQRGLIESTTRCARSRGMSFYFAHDFLAQDMAHDRNRARAALLRMRRDAVESQGGVFIDLQSTFDGRIGVSWFSDFIHLSHVGQREVATYLCERMAH